MRTIEAYLMNLTTLQQLIKIHLVSVETTNFINIMV